VRGILSGVSKLGTLRRSSLFELVFIVAVALSLALAVQAYAVKPYRIPSESMEPTLKVGERVLVNRFSHHLGAQPQVGDIVVFHPPAGADQSPERCGAPVARNGVCPAPTERRSEQTFIKRVVAVGGDAVSVDDGRVIRNGRRQREPYIAACGGGEGCDLPQPVRVPRGHVFLMGDNRGRSTDSRFWGPVPVSWVIGEAFATYWPPQRVGPL
jgi:signal peptidase I